MEGVNYPTLSHPEGKQPQRFHLAALGAFVVLSHRVLVPV